MEIYSVTKRALIKAVAGTLYEMAPANNPRNIDKIISYVSEWCDRNIGNQYLIRVSKTEINSLLSKMLMDCLEYRQLNISQARWDAGERDIDTNDHSFAAVCVEHDENGVPSKISKPKDYYDFIDLDAAIGNIVYSLCCDLEHNEDCFLCIHAKEYQSMEPSSCEECQRCTLNPKYKCNYMTHPRALVPRNKKEK